MIAMLAGVVAPLFHRDERRPPYADTRLHVQGAPELIYPIPIEAPATAGRSVKLVDFLRPDLKTISLPHGVHPLPAFTVAKASEEADERESSECGDAGVPHLAPL